MTNEELLAVLNAAIADARAATVNANAAANTANAAANQASSGAAAGVTGARTQSNVEDIQVGSDINVPEAWSANVKRTYDVHQTHDMERARRNDLHFDAMISEQTKHLSQLNALSLITLKDAQVASKLGDDRMWNINETDLAAKSAAVLTDAILAELARRAKAAA
jgi:hypothetical protein